MTSQNKLIFFGLVGGAIAIVALLLLLEMTNLYTLPTRATPHATITVVVAPELQSWVSQAAATFNQQDEQFQVEVRPQSLSGLEAEATLQTGSTTLPDVWIAESDFSRQLAGNIPYATTGPTVAQDYLVWVVSPQRADLRREFSWQAVHDTVVSDWQFRLTMPPPAHLDSLAACLAAAATYHEQTVLEPSMVRDAAFRQWVEELWEAIPNRNQAPLSLLTSRPPQAEVGLLLQRVWQEVDTPGFNQLPLPYLVPFNYPYLQRTENAALSAEDAATRQQVIEAFAAHLRSETQQNNLAAYGLTAADTVVSEQVVQTNDRIMQALQWCWK